jgi:hypothetical protein
MRWLCSSWWRIGWIEDRMEEEAKGISISDGGIIPEEKIYYITTKLG